MRSRDDDQWPQTEEDEFTGPSPHDAIAQSHARAKTQEALNALQSGVRALADTLVRTGRVPESEAQDMLKQLGVPPLERVHYRMRIKVTGTAVVDVMAGDTRDAQIQSGTIVDRGVRSMVSTMIPGGARVVELYRDGQPEVAGYIAPTAAATCTTTGHP